ncbi:MAG: 30S ribosomal protein S4 [Candidatus Liptonbacteria bacterium]|nr:30S ribosomal protein S4 [Candidatus Liptonbacteria bacterium]
MPKVKEKRERALGVHLHIKGERCMSPKCAFIRKPYRPGVHGQKRRRGTISDFGRQLQEKQKFKLAYGVSERELRRLFGAARKEKGSTATKLVELLERRLDNVVFRLGFAKSRAQAAQLIVHGHIFVNGRRTRSPGFAAKAGDTIHIRPDSRSKALFGNLGEALKKYEPPVWLALDLEKLEGKVVRLPAEAGVPFEVSVLVESFSK